MKREIDCIERLLDKNFSYPEICDWLLLNKLADSVDVENNVRTRERAEFVYSVLKQAQKDEKIMLLYFEWSLLPKETIKITCITETEEKFFTYGL